MKKFWKFKFLKNPQKINPYHFRHVVEACSFFKTNHQLLTGSNNIERKPPSPQYQHNYGACTSRATRPTTLIPGLASPNASNEAPCRTCFSVRKKLHPPAWAQPPNQRHVLCDCNTVSEIYTQVRAVLMAFFYFFFQKIAKIAIFQLFF